MNSDRTDLTSAIMPVRCRDPPRTCISLVQEEATRRSSRLLPMSVRTVRRSGTVSSKILWESLPRLSTSIFMMAWSGCSMIISFWVCMEYCSGTRTRYWVLSPDSMDRMDLWMIS